MIASVAICNLVKNVFKCGSFLWLLVPALLHELNALHWSMIWRNYGTAHWRRLPDLLYNF